MSRDTKQALREKGIIEEGFSQDFEDASQFVLKTKSSMSVPGIFSLIALFWMLIWTEQKLGWHIPTGIYSCVLLFFCLSSVLTFAFGGMPQRLVMTRGSSNGTLFIGYGRFAVKWPVRFNAIKGFILNSTVMKGVGRVPQLTLVWKDAAPPICVGTYLENEIALERAQYISERTGIPLVKVAMDPVVRRRTY